MDDDLITGLGYEDDALSRLIAVIAGSWWLIAGLVTLAALLIYVWSGRSPDTFRSDAEVRIFDPRRDRVFTDSNVSRFELDSTIETQIEIIESAPIVDAAATLLDESYATELQSISASRLRGTEIVRILASSTDPERARATADVVASVYVESAETRAASGFFRRAEGLRGSARALQPQVDDLQEEIDALDASEGGLQRRDLGDQRTALVLQQREFERRASELDIEGAIRSGGAQIVAPAELPTVPFSPRPLRDAVLGAVLALILGVGLVVLLDRLDVTVKDPAEFSRFAVGLPLLGSMPPHTPDGAPMRRRAKDTPRTLVPVKSAVGEAYRTLRAAVRFGIAGRNHRVIGITSAERNEGKSVVAAYLAASLSQEGWNTVVVSLDLRRPSLREFFDIRRSAPGVTSVVLGDVALADAVVPVRERAEGGSLYVVPAGLVPPNPTELLGLAEMKEMLEQLSSHADFVLLDCPPVLPVADALVISQYADAMIVVVAYGLTKKQQLQTTVARLDSVGANLLGGVLNGVPVNRRVEYYGYRDSSEDRAVDLSVVDPVVEVVTKDLMANRKSAQLLDSQATT